MQTFSWIPVTERLPERCSPDGCMSREVMVSLKDGEVSIDRMNLDYQRWIRFPKTVTHWAEKPRPADLENDR